MFQLLLKGCTIEARLAAPLRRNRKFQLLLKGCTIEAIQEPLPSIRGNVSVVVERMYD